MRGEDRPHCRRLAEGVELLLQEEGEVGHSGAVSSQGTGVFTHVATGSLGSSHPS